MRPYVFPYPYDNEDEEQWLSRTWQLPSDPQELQQLHVKFFNVFYIFPIYLLQLINYC